MGVGTLRSGRRWASPRACSIVNGSAFAVFYAMAVYLDGNLAAHTAAWIAAATSVVMAAAYLRLVGRVSLTRVPVKLWPVACLLAFSLSFAHVSRMRFPIVIGALLALAVVTAFRNAVWPLYYWARWHKTLERLHDYAFDTADPSELEHLIADLSAIAQEDRAPIQYKMTALTYRGVAYGKMDPPQTDNEIADYTAVIDDENASADLKMAALLNRAQTYQEMTPPKIDEAIADCTTVMKTKEAPATNRAWALALRAGAYWDATPPRLDEAIADCTAMLDMEGISSEQRALALILRAFTYSLVGPPEVGKMIADCTLVIGMADTPAERKAYALYYRSRALSMMDPPQHERNAADLRALIEMPDAPPDMKALALGTLAWVAYTSDEFETSAELSLKALAIDPDQHWCRANLGLALLCAGRTDEAIEAYRFVADAAIDPDELSHIALGDLNGLHGRQPDLAGLANAIALIEHRIADLSGH